METKLGEKKAEGMTIHAAFAAALYQVEKFGETERLATIFTALGLAGLGRAAHQARPFFHDPARTVTQALAVPRPAFTTAASRSSFAEPAVVT